MDIKLLTGLSIILLLAGCSKPVPPPTSDELVNTKLAEAAVTASHSLRSLAKIEQAIHPRAKVIPPPNPASYGMAAKTSIDWNGPVEQVVKRIANISGYKLEVLGKRPAIPIMVTLAARNTPIGDILRDIGFQADKRAHIVVFPATKTIELRYAKK